MEVSLAQDLVEHKYWGVDGARVEATGVAPMRFSASIPMYNGIVPGKAERWGVLYPDATRKLFAAFADKKTGFLQHPEFGLVPCKPERLKFEWSGDRQGGCECEASWVETLEDDSVANFFAASPVQEVTLAALNLDASDTDLRKLAPPFPKYQTSWSDIARSIQAITDYPTLLANNTAGKINAITYRVEQLEDSVARAKSALTWEVQNSIERVKAQTDHLREQVLQTKERFLVLYQVKYDTTVGGLVAQLQDVKLADLIRLNPQLMRQAEVYKGTVIRYYAPKKS